MKIIIPMAGRGSRLRPHTLTIPKPLIPIAGKPIVQRLVEDIAKVCDEAIEEVAFIIGDFGTETESNLLKIADTLGAKGSIYHQEEALGTAHAILCAKASLSGNVVVAFADTLFRADFKLDASSDGIIWGNQIEEPSAFGVVKLDSNQTITDFVEKPKDFVSDLAIIGIYFFKSGETLKAELQYLLDNNIQKGGEYQLTDALENMKQKGMLFVPGQVDEWMDCGNKPVTVETNSRMLGFLHAENETLVSKNITINNSTIIEPCFIGDGVVLNHATIGPNVSIGANSEVNHSTIKNSLIQNHVSIKNANLNEAMIGNFASFNGEFKSISIGDYSVLE